MSKYLYRLEGEVKVREGDGTPERMLNVRFVEDGQTRGPWREASYELSEVFEFNKSHEKVYVYVGCPKFGHPDKKY